MPHNGEGKECYVCHEPIDPRNYVQVGADQFFHPDCLEFMREQYQLELGTHQWIPRKE